MPPTSKRTDIWPDPSQPRSTMPPCIPFQYAVCYDEGSHNFKRDKALAVQYYQKAVNEESHVESMVKLALILESGAPGVDRNITEAVKLYDRAIAEGGDVSAMYYRARLLHYGTDGVSKDPNKAASLYSRAVEKGNHVKAMNSLGALLLEDYQQLRDPCTALMLFERALRCGGGADVKLNLARLLQRGDAEVPQDRRRAKELYRDVLGEKGDADAMYDLAVLLETTEKNPAEAVKWYWEAAQNGNHLRARRRLARLLWNGADGVARRPEKALQLLEEAIDLKRDKSDILRMAGWLTSDHAGRLRDAKRAFRLLGSLNREQLSPEESSLMSALEQRCIVALQSTLYSLGRPNETGYDLFISHAGAEKKSVAMPLQKALASMGLKCFLDESDLQVSVQTNCEQIMHALHHSRSVVFILSREFITRKWPMLELFEALKMRSSALGASRRPLLLIPLFYRLTVGECKDFLHMLSTDQDGILQALQRNGYFDTERVEKASLNSLHNALRELAGLKGIRNDNALNGPEYAAMAAGPIARAYFRNNFAERQTS